MDIMYKKGQTEQHVCVYIDENNTYLLPRKKTITPVLTFDLQK